VECAQISCLLRSRILMLCACKKLDKDNKEEELVDVAPRWGVNHVNTVLFCFMRCLDVFMSLLAKCFDIDR
jgi:hypothetical protein